MSVPAAATFVQGTVGTVPTVAGGGIIPPGTYYLIKQIVGSGTPVNKKIATSGDGNCFTAVEVSPDNTEARFSGTATYAGEKSTTTITCPFPIVVEPTFQVLEPIDGKVHYATLAPDGNDYREWLQELPLPARASFSRMGALQAASFAKTSSPSRASFGVENMGK
jgi:hypothetical protein